IRALANVFNDLTRGLDVTLTHLPLGWNGAYRHFRQPLDYLGANGGGGVGDGDFLMGVTALWTAAHYRVPCLLLIANNRSFYNDEMHQERVARERSRPVENKWIGQRI